jgi:hypothetical protein
MVLVAPLTTLVSLSTLFCFTSAATVQKPLLQLPADAAQNLQAVKDIFLYSYDAYKSVLLDGTALEEILMVAIAGSTHGVMTT